MCDECEDDREKRGCENPHACVTSAASRLRQILPKWVPNPTEEVQIENARAEGHEDGTAFRPPHSITSLSQGLRTLTLRTGEPKERPAPATRRRAQTEPAPESLTIYIAGAIHTAANGKKIAAAGILVGPEDSEGTGKCIPSGYEQSQYVAEFFAALEAIRGVRTETALTIVSAQSYVHDAMNKKLSNWEHQGWVGVRHRGILRCVAAELKARKARTIFKVAAPGTPARALCKKAARRAKRTAKTPSETVWDLSIPPETALLGLSLQNNRQKTFYRGIREEKTKKVKPRVSTVKKIATVRLAASEAFGRQVSDAEIWHAASVKDILPRTSQFLWKGLHDAHRIGAYWAHLPGFEDRAVCKECGTLEDLEHIMTGCASPGQELIWNAAKTLWLEKESNWPEVSLGSILGCGLAEFRDDAGKVKRGTQRLYRILMSESAYLIWKLRNDRVISRDGVPASEEEITNKWRFAINQRLQMDKLMANRPLRGKRPALAPHLVLETWSKTLDNERSLPANWLREPRVLVGSRAFSQTSRRQNSRGIG
ncbi:hypothetical protein C8R47DRAFT_1050204 [Mycena vitilis]|nr:hypothetical protein C8R47DRAFT_1050204 [Mycena vitilis]